MEGEDRALSLHRDTSIATLNVNLNNPEDDFQGSQLYFYELGKVLSDSNKHYVTFEAGKALIHLGEQMHAATEILEGERTNLIIWMYRTPDPDDVFGYDHAIAKDYAPEEQMTVDQRWNPY